MASVRSPLSVREVEVVGLVIEGHSTTAIANLLFLSPDTIKTHLKNIFRKCRVHNRAELTAWWYKKEALLAASASDGAAQATAKVRRSRLPQIALAAVILVAAVIPFSPASDHPQTIVTLNVTGGADVARTRLSDDGLEPSRRGATVCEQMGRDTGANDSSVCVPATAP